MFFGMRQRRLNYPGGGRLDLPRGEGFSILRGFRLQMTSSSRLVFIRRLCSSVVLWGVALWIIFAGFEVGFFFLIGSIGLLGLWEFYRMLDHKGLPNFKMLGMICAVFGL